LSGRLPAIQEAVPALIAATVQAAAVVREAHIVGPVEVGRNAFHPMSQTQKLRPSGGGGINSDAFEIMPTSEREIWGMALWVEKHHGADGPQFIASQIDRLANEPDGQALWRKVDTRFAELKAGPVPIYGKPETWPH